MYILVVYDVDTTTKEGAIRLRHVAKACINYGQRVQNSVFECDLSEAQFCLLKDILSNIIDKKKDSVRIYYLSKNFARRVETLGKETSYDVSGTIII